MKPATSRIVHWIALAAGIALLYDGSWGCVYSAEKNITPYTGIITADAVNVRSGPGVDFEILCQLETDDLVLVQDSTLDWLKITLPRIGKAYVSSQYLIPTSTLLGTINANNINIRAGEGTNFNVIGQLNKNDPVEIVAKDGD
ncbi:MAG: SH3 domain-containing protein, partial [Candidatus Omnitrophica bacterium]|nr:SH3 domain-containing protein [Candidatus Omnitrophota bacterium]